MVATQACKHACKPLLGECIHYRDGVAGPCSQHVIHLTGGTRGGGGELGKHRRASVPRNAAVCIVVLGGCSKEAAAAAPDGREAVAMVGIVVEDCVGGRAREEGAVCAETAHVKAGNGWG